MCLRDGYNQVIYSFLNKAVLNHTNNTKQKNNNTKYYKIAKQQNVKKTLVKWSQKQACA